jgi:hypothetical protein
MSQKPIFRMMLILGFAELFSALLFICVPPIQASIGLLLPGALFGATLSVCLWLTKISHVFWKMLAVTAATSIALPVSVLVGLGGEYGSPFVTVHKFSEESNTALFAGGTSGAFLVIAAVLLLVNSKAPRTRVLINALCWSPVGGVLAIVGWNLGPWLGMTLWSLRHELNLTLPGDRFEYALGQGRAGIESMLLVWQTGMGLLLGFAVNQILASRRELVGLSPG